MFKRIILQDGTSFAVYDDLMLYFLGCSASSETIATDRFLLKSYNHSNLPEN
jgi:hypothetical protein